MLPTIDLFILSARPGPLREEVLRGIEQQRGVRCRAYRVIGRRQTSDTSRYDTIARARNRAKLLGDSPWAMYLDDDVALGTDCILRLVTALERLPGWGVLAADYLNQSRGRRHVEHVSMGATLFRRSVLERIRFRWETGRCECRCCCDDLQGLGIRIGYLPGASARHLPREETRHGHVRDEQVASVSPSPQILTALDANHFALFHRLFLGTFSATGNRYPITVIAYGIGRVQEGLLRGHPLVAQVVSRPPGSLSPGVRRVCDFQHVLERWPPATPVAFWDAGDVLFQKRIDRLWRIVRSHPDRIMAVSEPAAYPRNPALGEWASRIPDSGIRQRVFKLLASRPSLNGGFVAGTAESILEYLQFAGRFLDLTHLSRDPWSDQIALNYYCHSRPERWLEVEEGWNYCLAYRRPRFVQQRYRPDADWHPSLANLPRFVTAQGKPVAVVHGNGKTLEGTLKCWWTTHPSASVADRRVLRLR